MIRNYIGVLFLCFLSYNSFSQGQTYDSAYLSAKYSYRYRPDSSNPTRINEDLLILEVGKKYSKYYSYYKMISDSIVYANSNDQTGVDIQKASANLKGVRAGTTKVILRNLSTNVFTVSHSFGTTNYRYVDSVKLMKWIISTDTLTIATFQCTKASTLFRGRNYEAWFTTQVPLSIGPSLFRGLPGMIVKIKELKGNFEFTLVSLENLVPLKPIYLGKEKFTLVSRKEYRKNLDAFYNDFDAFMLSQGMSIKVRTPDGSPPPPQEKIVHNPMELE